MHSLITSLILDSSGTNALKDGRREIVKETRTPLHGRLVHISTCRTSCFQHKLCTYSTGYCTYAECLSFESTAFFYQCGFGEILFQVPLRLRLKSHADSSNNIRGERDDAARTLLQGCFDSEDVLVSCKTQTLIEEDVVFSNDYPTFHGVPQCTPSRLCIRLLSTRSRSRKRWTRTLLNQRATIYLSITAINSRFL